MTIRSRGRKKSNFPAQTGVLSDASFDYFVNGVNYKITFTDFLTALNVTGSIVQDGAVTGTPVLDTAGPVHNIRNLEDGSGVKASVSPENGITLDHNFTSGSGGVPVLTSISETSPIIRSIAAGDGVSVSASNGSVVISATEAPPTTGIVIVNSVDDLPDPIGDVITLDSGFSYSLQGLIDISPYRIESPSLVEIFAENRLARGFVTDNVGALITVLPGAVLVCREMLMSAPLGRRFDVQVGGGLVINNCLGIASATEDTFTDAANISFRNFSLFSFGDPVYGWKFSGTCVEFNMDNSFVSDYTGTAIDFSTATFDRGFVIGSGVRFLGDPGTFAIDGAPASANIVAGSEGLVLACKNTGTGDFLTGNITKKDTRWNFQHNQGVENSTILGVMGLVNNVTDTVLSTGAYVQITGTQIASDNIERCQVNGSEQLEFLNEQEVCGLASANIDLVRSGSGTNTYLFSVFKNGAQVELTSGQPVIASIEVSATDTHVNILAPVCFKESDVFDVRINRQGGTADLLVTNMVMTIS